MLKGIEETDTDWLTLVDRSCSAIDFGPLAGMPPDAHFWVWCSRPFTEEEELEHEDEPDSLAHYNCGTETEIHTGETAGDGVPGWKLEPHIRYSNTIQTPKGGSPTGKHISMPIECEWPTTSVGADPMGFTLGTYQYRIRLLNSDWLFIFHSRF